MENQSWFVASTIVGREREGEAQLSRFQTFLPLYHVTRTVVFRTDRLKQALFPGYFFLRCHIDHRPLKRNYFRGLVGLNGPGIGEPLMVESAAIDELMSVVDEHRIYRAPALKPGTEVEILGGDTFWGKRGLYECSRGEDRVIVLLSALVPFRVEVNRNQVREVAYA